MQLLVAFSFDVIQVIVTEMYFNVGTKVCIYPILACFSFILSVNRVENISFLECTTQMQKSLQHIQRPWEESSILPTGHTASNFQRNALNIGRH